MDLSTVNRREILRYLGDRNGNADESLCALIEDVLLELNEKITPKHVVHTYPLAISETEEVPLLDMSCMQVRSKDLAKALRGCDEVMLFAATLGDGADFLTRRYEKTDMARASVCQAAGAEMIEAYCNQINRLWKEDYEKQNKRLRPRFSCGYGDFSLEAQRAFHEVLQMEKRLGIRLTEGLLMVPTKSVTAVIGIGGA